MSNSLDPDQAQHFVGPDLDLNCLQKLPADDAGKGLNVNTCNGVKCKKYETCQAFS